MGAYAYAYVVTLSGAQKLLRYARPLRMPADWVVGYSPPAGVRLYAVKPPCVRPDPAVAGLTTIGDRETPDTVPDPPRPLRNWVGTMLLVARQAGLWPDSYVKRLRAAQRDASDAVRVV